MRVPLSWLREYVPVTESAEALMERFTMLGFGHEPIERTGDEAVFDLEVASNRPDLLSIVGVARELAAALGREVTLPAVTVEEGPAPTQSLADVVIEDTDGCPRYTAHVITGVRIRPSPPWLVRRLEAAGIRPINNVVDVTNYVMLELGEPLHAFDLDLLTERRIVVRRARRGEALTTLDGVARVLDPEVLVIADAERPVALAGIMGGAESEIAGSTSRVLLEAAAFDGPAIRRTSRRLGVRTESSARFERSLDPRIVLDAARRAAALIREVAGGQVLAEPLDVYPRPAAPAAITLRLARIRRVLGVEVEPAEVEAILRRLGCAVAPDGGRLTVVAPAGRVDLTREEDLIEEVARHHGYDRIPETLPVDVTQPGSRPARVEGERRLRERLIRAGLTEALTLSLGTPEVYDRLGVAPDDPARRAVAVANPLLADHTHLRTMLLPGLLEAVRVNQSRRVDDVHLFEIGRTFHPLEDAERGAAAEGVVERLRLGVVMAGPLIATGWNLPAEAREATVFHLKGILEAVWRDLGVPVAAEPSARSWLHPARCARLLLERTEVGVLGELPPAAAARWDLRGRVAVAELDLEAVLPRIRLLRRFEPLPRFPAVDRDLAIIVGAPSHAEVLAAVREAGGDLLEDVSLFDVYTGPPVPADHRSLAYRLRFRAPDRTLTAEEVEAVLGRIRARLRRRLRAEVRE